MSFCIKYKNSFLNYILIKLCNSIGASIATVVSQLVVVIIEFYMIRKDINIKKVIKSSYTYILASGIMLAICLCLRWVLGASLKVMVIQIVVGGAVYVGMLYLLKDDYLGMFINKTKSLLLRKSVQ